MDINGKQFAEYIRRKNELDIQRGKEAQKKQHSKGKLTALERIEILFDNDTFEEIDAYVKSATASGFGKVKSIYSDGVIIGYGKINGRLAYVYSQDFTSMGGSLGSNHAKKICKIQDMALKVGAPIIGIIDSGGARIQEGVASLAGYAAIFNRNVKSSGVIPQISVIMGPAAGGAVYSPAITDYIFMTNKTSYMFVTGPNVVKEVLNEDVSFDDLGGAMVHAKKSGVAQLIYEDEENTLLGVRKLLTYLPSNNLENPPFIPNDDMDFRKEDILREIVPDDANKPYDVKDIIKVLIDKGTFFEISEHYAQNIVIGLARLAGKAIGIIANQPKVLAGTLDINSSTKTARFIRFCDSFNIPILTLEDVPGFLPGIDQEHSGIIRHGAKLLYAYADSTIPKITVILRKSYGGAYCVMNSKNLGGDFNLAWPTAEIAVMGPEGAVAILFKNELAGSSDPAKLRKELATKYREEVANPYIADEQGYIDEVIDPADTRNKLIKAFEALENKHINVPSRKHGNIPL